MERMMKKRPTAPTKKERKLYLNQQLEIELNSNSNSATSAHSDGNNAMDWATVYTRENARILVAELKESMAICVEAFIDERNKNIANALMDCEGRNVVALVNFSNVDGIE